MDVLAPGHEGVRGETVSKEAHGQTNGYQNRQVNGNSSGDINAHVKILQTDIPMAVVILIPDNLGIPIGAASLYPFRHTTSEPFGPILECCSLKPNDGVR